MFEKIGLVFKYYVYWFKCKALERKINAARKRVALLNKQIEEMGGETT